MYKVLIVDDEPMIREGLRSLIPWEKAGFQVVGVANNGLDALDKHQVTRPDLMIVDIRMPGMDGLQLIEAIRTSDSAVHFLILSGYADFDYAKKAMKHRVDGYILKPVDEDEFLDYLIKLKTVLEHEKAIRSQEGDGADWSRDRILQALLSGAVTPELLQAVKSCGMQWKYYQPLYIHCHGVDMESPELSGLRDALKKTFEESGRGFVFIDHTYTGLLLKEDLGLDVNRKALTAELAPLFRLMETCFVAAAGPIARSPEEIHHSCSKAIEAMKHRFFLPINDISSGLPKLRDNTVQERAEGASEPDFDDFVDRLFYAVDIGNRETVSKSVVDAGSLMAKAGYSEQQVKTYFAQMVTGALNKLSVSMPANHGVIQETINKVVHFYEQPTFSELEHFAVEILSHLIEQTVTGKVDTSLKRMVDLIQRNYQQNLKLETLADAFNYNSAYLGKIFKNYTGESFNTYLDKVRIDRAKALLEQGYKVYEVAELVGFANVDYFHIKFRKYVGISPSGYRKNQITN